MPVVLSDTSRLHYLVLIGESEVLPALYGRVLIPHSVANELSHPNTPESVRLWISNRPSWLDEFANPSSDSNVLRHLDPGERDTILLALELKADLVLMDDREGVEEARRLGLQVTGTLGILDRAAKWNWVDFPAAVTRLTATNFRASPALLERLLTDAARRREPMK